MATPSYDPLRDLTEASNAGVALGSAIALNNYRQKDLALRRQQLQSEAALRRLQEQQLAQNMALQLAQHNQQVDMQADMTKAMAQVQLESRPTLPVQAPIAGPPEAGANPDFGSVATQVPNPAYVPFERSMMNNVLPVIAKHRPQEVPTFILDLAKSAQATDNPNAPGAIQTIQAPDGGRFNVYVPPHGRGATQLVGEAQPEMKVEGNRTFIRDKSGNWKPLTASSGEIQQRMANVANHKLAMENPDLAVANPDAPGLRMIDPQKWSQFEARQGTTGGVKTKLEMSLEQTQKTISALQDLQKTLRPEDVGARAVISNELLDKWLPQVGIDYSDAQRMDNRTKLKALTEGMLRQVSDDTRFSNTDREDIKRILPSAGARESYPNAIRTAHTLEQIFAKRALIDAQTLGRATPPWAVAAMSKDKLLEAAGNGLIDEDGLIMAFKLGKITQEEAQVLHQNRPKG